MPQGYTGYKAANVKSFLALFELIKKDSNVQRCTLKHVLQPQTSLMHPILKVKRNPFVSTSSVASHATLQKCTWLSKTSGQYMAGRPLKVPGIDSGGEAI